MTFPDGDQTENTTGQDKISKLKEEANKRWDLVKKQLESLSSMSKIKITSKPIEFSLISIPDNNVKNTKDYRVWVNTFRNEHKQSFNKPSFLLNNEKLYFVGSRAVMELNLPAEKKTKLVSMFTIPKKESVSGESGSSVKPDSLKAKEKEGVTIITVEKEKCSEIIKIIGFTPDSTEFLKKSHENEISFQSKIADYINQKNGVLSEIILSENTDDLQRFSDECSLLQVISNTMIKNKNLPGGRSLAEYFENLAKKSPHRVARIDDALMAVLSQEGMTLERLAKTLNSPPPGDVLINKLNKALDEHRDPFKRFLNWCLSLALPTTATSLFKEAMKEIVKKTQPDPEPQNSNGHSQTPQK